MQLPLGDPQLMWSFNREGECDPKLIADRDRAMGLDTAAKRETRQEMIAVARPRHGVDAMKDQFSDTRHFA